MSKKVLMKPDDFKVLVKQLLDEAGENQLVLRVMGALATLIQLEDSPNCLQLYNKLGRVEAGVFQLTDLDLAAYKKQRGKIEEFFRKKGYKPDHYVNAVFGDRRAIFYHPENLFTVDVFFSPLLFSHEIDLGSEPGKGRLELGKYTLSPADLLLLKLQIHDINRKDLADMAVLLSCLELSDGDETRINLQRITSLLSDDWGFYFDAVTNLNKLKLFMQEYTSKLTEYNEILQEGLRKIETIVDSIEKTPKSEKWIKRSKVGTKKRWYNVVEEV
ncbi:MAG: hypothetical protein ABWK01_06800 [Infirmifilum sp.]